GGRLPTRSALRRHGRRTAGPEQTALPPPVPRSPTGAVRPGQDLEHVPVGVVEVAAPAAVPGVELAGDVVVGVGPVGHVPGPDAAEDLVELPLADEEGVVLVEDLAVAVVDEVECDVVVDDDAEERAEGLRLAEAQDLGQERGRDLLVPGVDDRVVELDGHAAVLLSWG